MPLNTGPAENYAAMLRAGKITVLLCLLPWLSGDFRIPCGFLACAPQGRLAPWEWLVRETQDEDI